MIFEIKNDFLTVKISSLGAEIQSVTDGEKEYIWNGDEKFWTGKAPVLFPICGGLPDDEFTYKGNSYTLKKHGFTRHSEFEVEKKEEDRIVFLLKSNEETLRQYPFEFELRQIYELSGNMLKVETAVNNLTDGEMYFTTGSHEAYACPEGIEDYKIIFDKDEELIANALKGNLLTENTQVILSGEKELPLKESYFEIDALVFKKHNSDKAVLTNGKRTIEVDFAGYEYLLIWQKCGAGYICIEPWHGIPPMENSSKAIEEKEGMVKLKKGENYSTVHTIKFS